MCVYHIVIIGCIDRRSSYFRRHDLSSIMTGSCVGSKSFVGLGL